MPINEMLNASSLLISLLFIIIFIFFGRLEYKVRILMILGFSLIALSVLYDIFLSYKFYMAVIWIFPFVMVSYFLFYPLFYHYILNFFNEGKKLILEKKKFLFSALMAILILVFYLPAGLNQKMVFVQEPRLIDFSINPSLSAFNFLVFFFYYFQALWFIFQFWKLYKINKKQYFDASSRYVPKWLFLTLCTCLIYELFLSIFLIITPSLSSPWPQLVLLFIIIFIGLLGLYHDNIVLMLKMEKMANNLPLSNFKKNNKVNVFNSVREEELRKTLDELMIEEQLFRNPGLKLEHLAKRLHIPKQQFSAFINQSYKMNFTQLVNKYRIEYAKLVLRSSSQENSLERLYPDFGFYSRSTFNRVFKDRTNQSPAEFRQKIKN